MTYGTNNEFGFDYLRDNMKFRLEDMVQRPFHYAIVDEVDSILIDEARTPLIISGPTEDNSELYIRVDKLIPTLEPDDYEKDEKQRTVTLTEAGVEKIEAMLRDTGLMTTGTLYDIHNVALVHHVNQALRAHKLFARDTDYIVKDDKIVIIDEFTGRMMEGRRYSEGLHQALEAKEGVTVQNENQTLASITFQNYFRLYPKLAGMTGTAMTEAQEFGDIYKLEVIEIPTNEPVRRERYRRRGLSHARARNTTRSCSRCWNAASAQQPVLVGTVSIEKSEALSALFKKAQDPAQRAERALSRAGSLHHRPGRPARRGHDRHQHGRPRHRHPARRQSRHAAAHGAGGDRRIRTSASARAAAIRAEIEAGARGSGARPAGSSSSAASGTRAGASTISCAAAPAARAIPAPPNSSSRSKTI